MQSQTGPEVPNHLLVHTFFRQRGAANRSAGDFFEIDFLKDLRNWQRFILVISFEFSEMVTFILAYSIQS